MKNTLLTTSAFALMTACAMIATPAAAIEWSQENVSVIQPSFGVSNADQFGSHASPDPEDGEGAGDPDAGDPSGTDGSDD